MGRAERRTRARARAAAQRAALASSATQVSPPPAAPSAAPAQASGRGRRSRGPGAAAGVPASAAEKFQTAVVFGRVLPAPHWYGGAGGGRSGSTKGVPPARFAKDHAALSAAVSPPLEAHVPEADAGGAESSGALQRGVSQHM